MSCVLKIIAEAASQIWDDRLKIILLYWFRGALTHLKKKQSQPAVQQFFTGINRNTQALKMIGKAPSRIWDDWLRIVSSEIIGAFPHMCPN